MKNLDETIHDYVAVHEKIIGEQAHKRDENLDVRFTR